ncbi:hypothetical protein T4A_8462 [Trichinella pseudospiralis]|uniref:Uncharacterized protein n=1 Tax=Trichinella pseudospiralis TaxID=6337 RepID=A0A0V1E092_TRIPS|nr:hypothetical protein T4A_8462 [Trichinella pseudospiralis]
MPIHVASMSASVSGRVASDVATILYGRDDDVVYSFQHPVVDCLLSFITFVAWRCWVDALLEGALALQMSMADNARFKDLGGFVQRQDVTFLKKTSPYIVVVDAKDNLTQQPNSFTITEATTIRQLTRWHVASWLLTSVTKRGDLNRHCIFVKPVVRTILYDRPHNQDRQTLHLYSSSSVKLMVDKDRNTFHFFNHMSNGPLNSSKSNEEIDKRDTWAEKLLHRNVKPRIMHASYIYESLLSAWLKIGSRIADKMYGRLIRSEGTKKVAA